MRAEKMNWDTHAAFNTLTETYKFNKTQAEGVIKIVQDSKEFDLANLVTKTQFDSAMDKIDSKFQAIDSEFKLVRTEIELVKVELSAKIDVLDAKIDAAVSGLDAKIDAAVSRLDAKIDAAVSGLDAKIDATAARTSAEILESIHKMFVNFVFYPTIVILVAIVAFGSQYYINNMHEVTPEAVEQHSIVPHNK